MKNRLKLYLSSLALVPLLMTVQAEATIYKCVNFNAEVYYNDKPCPTTEIERQLKAVKDPNGGYIPPDFISKKQQPGSQGVVVGSTNGRSVNNTENGDSDSSSKGSNSNNSGSVSSSQSSSASNQNGSSSSGTSHTKTNNNSAANNGNSKRSVKNIIHKEGQYKEGS